MIFHPTSLSHWQLESTVLNNCTVANNVVPTSSSTVYGGGAYSCILSNSLVTGNRAYNGGGAAESTLFGSTISNNVANVSSFNGGNGGGVYHSVLNACLIFNNICAWGFGGGCYNSTLTGCTVAGNLATNLYGGGAYIGSMHYCVVSNNIAFNGGGGICQARATNCLIIGNSARYDGGSLSSIIVNSDIISNSATLGAGGDGGSTLDNCILYYNFATNSPNYSGSTLNYCCTWPDAGGNNITNDPALINLSTGDYHLSFNSPCINAGKNAYVVGTNDLDGNPRIVGGTVDIGCYEFQTPSSMLSFAWAQQYGLPTDGSADFTDADGDGMNNWQEWIAGVVPTNAASVLKMNPPTNAAPGWQVSWQSVNTRTYYLQRSTNLLATPVFSTLQSNLVGQANSTSFTDTSATNGGSYFYRVGVQ